MPLSAIAFSGKEGVPLWPRSDVVVPNLDVRGAVELGQFYRSDKRTACRATVAEIVFVDIDRGTVGHLVRIACKACMAQSFVGYSTCCRYIKALHVARQRQIYSVCAFVDLDGYIALLVGCVAMRCLVGQGRATEEIAVGMQRPFHIVIGTETVCCLLVVAADKDIVVEPVVTIGDGGDTLNGCSVRLVVRCVAGFVATDDVPAEHVVYDAPPSEYSRSERWESSRLLSTI